MAARIAQPWRWSPTMRPKTLVSAAPMREDRDHLDEVGHRVGVLEGMGGVGVEEAAAVGAEHLDGDLRGDRADGDGLLGALERGGVDIGAERLRHAAPDEDQRQHDADRQQARRASRGSMSTQKLAERPWRRRARKPRISATAMAMPVAAETKFCTRQAGHLREIGHRALAAVVLPVGVGDEAGGGVEGEARAPRRPCRPG